LERAKSVLLEDPDEAISIAKNVAETVDYTIRSAKPEVRLIFLETTNLFCNTWEEVSIIIKNDGNVAARIDELSFERCEVELVAIPKVVRPRSKEMAKVLLKPLDKGKVPIKITVKFRDTLNNEVVESQRIIIRVWDDRKHAIEELMRNIGISVKDVRISEMEILRILEAIQALNELERLTYRDCAVSECLDRFDVVRLYLNDDEINELNLVIREIKAHRYPTDKLTDDEKSKIKTACKFIIDKFKSKYIIKD